MKNKKASIKLKKSNLRWYESSNMIIFGVLSLVSTMIAFPAYLMQYVRHIPQASFLLEEFPATAPPIVWFVIAVGGITPLLFVIFAALVFKRFNRSLLRFFAAVAVIIPIQFLLQSLMIMIVIAYELHVPEFGYKDEVLSLLTILVLGLGTLIIQVSICLRIAGAFDKKSDAGNDAGGRAQITRRNAAVLQSKKALSVSGNQMSEGSGVVFNWRAIGLVVSSLVVFILVAGLVSAMDNSVGKFMDRNDWVVGLLFCAYLFCLMFALLKMHIKKP